MLTYFHRSGGSSFSDNWGLGKTASFRILEQSIFVQIIFERKKKGMKEKEEKHQEEWGWKTPPNQQDLCSIRPGGKL